MTDLNNNYYNNSQSTLHDIIHNNIQHPFLIHNGFHTSHIILYIHFCTRFIENILRTQKNTSLIAAETDDCLTLSCLFYSCAILNIGLLPINPALPNTIKKNLITNSNADAFISQNNSPFGNINCYSIDCINTFIDIDSDFITTDKYLKAKKIIQLVIASSGTGSQPKLIPLSTTNIFSHINSLLKRIPLGKNDSWLNCLPLHHIAGAMILYRCLASKASMQLTDKFDADKIWHLIQTHQVSHISLVPIMLHKLLVAAKGSPPPNDLKYVLVGGDYLNHRLLRQAKDEGWPIIISYGMTEACSTIATASENEKLTLLDDIEAKTSADGLLLFSGPMLTEGYIGQTNKSKWINSNDYGEIDGRNLVVTGRTINTIVSGGITLSAEFIEQLFANCPYIKDIAISSIYHPSWGNTIIALVDGDIEKTKTWSKNNIDKQMQPKDFIQCNHLPRNALGKIQRDAIKLMVENLSHSHSNNKN